MCAYTYVQIEAGLFLPYCIFCHKLLVSIDKKYGKAQISLLFLNRQVLTYYQKYEKKKKSLLPHYAIYMV